MSDEVARVHSCQDDDCRRIRAARWARLARQLRRMAVGPSGIVLSPPMNRAWRRLQREEDGW